MILINLENQAECELFCYTGKGCALAEYIDPVYKEGDLVIGSQRLKPGYYYFKFMDKPIEVVRILSSLQPRYSLKYGKYIESKDT